MTRIVAPLSADERAAMIAAARTLLKVRWRHQGRSYAGVDCAGLVYVALQAVGRQPQDVHGYGRVAYRGRLEATLEANLGPIQPRETMAAGDVPLIHFVGAPSHVGILFDHPNGGFALVHAFAQMRKVVEHGLDKSWLDAIVGVYKP
jgi:cell wall-associated NlpC family hydrolase